MPDRRSPSSHDFEYRKVLKPHTEWINHCRKNGLPLDTPAPREYESYAEWYKNTRGVNPISGKRDLKNYSDWIFERNARGLSSNTPAPEGYESEAEWFRRTRLRDPVTHEPLPNEFVEAQRRENGPVGRLQGTSGAASTTEATAPPTPSQAAQTPTGSSGFLRRAIAGAGSVASRLGAIGSSLRGALPVIGAISTIIHAIVESKEIEKAPAPSNVERADATTPHKGQGHHGPRIV